MGRADRDFGTPQKQPTVEGFNPGGDDFGVVRIIDGHDTYNIGTEGSNVHVPSGGDPGWHDPVGLPVQDC